MKSHARMCTTVVSLFVALVWSVVAAYGQTPLTFNFDDFTKDNPFRLNFIPTTPFGPAWADILDRPSNFLLCKGAPTALCYYSGPEGSVTPCVADGTHKGRTNCTCYEIPGGSPYLVDINAILNLDVYLETIKVCGRGGENCLPRGKMPAPVCDYINNNTLIPGADLISTFSFFLEKTMPTDELTTCSTRANYGGCMTAPCTKTGGFDENTGLPLVQCACPLYDGPYQVSQDLAVTGNKCVLDSPYTWSAAYNPVDGNISPPSPPPCYPDAPGENGCPLLLAEVTLPHPPADIDCKKVCSEYGTANQDGIQIPYTCDATLCTASKGDLNLVGQACSGLQEGSIGEILKLEVEVGYSCAASQICGCRPTMKTNEEIFDLNQAQRTKGITTQCDRNGTLCGTPH